MRLGVTKDYQAANRKQGGHPVRAPLPAAALLLFDKIAQKGSFWIIIFTKI
jgi:hypothetical protein